MAAEIKLPVIGSVDKRYVYAGGAVVVVIVGYAYWTTRQGGAGALAGEVPAEDLGEAALEDGTYVPGTDYVPPVVQTPPPSVEVGEVISTDAEWARAAVTALTDVGVDTLAASAAVGRYIAGLSLSPTAADIIRQALALVGNLPSGDKPVKLEPVTAPPATNPAGTSLPGPAGLRGTAKKTTVDLSWSPVAGADYYRVYRAGVGQNIGSSEDTKAHIGGLSPNTTYTFQVRAVGHDGQYGAASAQTKLKTSK